MGEKLEILIIGGSAAGPTAAANARRKSPGAGVTMLEQGDFVSVGAWELAYYIGDVIKDHQELIARTPEEFRSRQQIDVRLQHLAQAIDRDRARVRVLDRISGKETELPYDRLIVATGARSRKLGLPGEDSENIFSLKGLADGIRMRRFVDEHQPRKAVIVGAGYISLEVAEALRERKVETTLLYRGETPYSGLEPELGPIIVDELKAHGVDFQGNVQVRAFETEGRQAKKIATDKGDFEADLFFVGIGVEPRVELAREAGLAIGPAGGIQVNDRMQTGDPLIFAAGDCCEKLHRVTGRPVISPLGDTANKEGRVAGENAAGGDSRFYGIVGAASSKIFNVEIGMAGITEAAAKRLGFTAVSQAVEAKSRVGIYPGAQYSLLKIVADQTTGRLLGGNWIGRDGEARKINTLAVALHNNMTLEEISRMDLAYAPPFSPVWDPLLIAAGLLKRKVNK